MIRKVKDWLGIEGVKIELEVPETFTLKNGSLSGSYKISSLSDQFVVGVKLILKEKYTRGRRKSKLIDEFVIGESEMVVNQSIDKENVIVNSFELNFNAIQSPMDRFGDKNPIYSGLSSIAKLLKNAKSKYYLIGEVTVKGNKLQPYDKVELVLS